MCVYSNGLPEVILGKTIKQHNFNRDEIVVMTKRAIFTVGHTNDTKHKPESGCYINRPADCAISNGLTPFISIQNHYCMLYREEEREMMPTLKANYFDPGHKRNANVAVAALWSRLNPVVASRAGSTHPPSLQQEATVGAPEKG
ncbi:hypothetical protein FIBSPDRAFT_1041200 [Athelia psychrophila]|uniref:Uncharacterized protein n=1 Tax=Athelia psychrophila TaxID=1759441 RepID=A0A166P8L0_9AGAM|nr:hypothetical protein FIBSPDRAFT_1041200 [Fibularhizoctonia sp. CBS 109695]